MRSQINENDLLHQAALLAADLYAEEVLSKASSLSKTSHNRIDSHEVRESMKSVKKELDKSAQARKAICAGLSSVKNDIREVTKIVGAALLPLSLSGVIAIPITPLEFAVAGLIVFDAGVSAFCSEFKSEKEG
jgi:magnesium-transporting ATPase (P-type)